MRLISRDSTSRSSDRDTWRTKVWAQIVPRLGHLSSPGNERRITQRLKQKTPEPDELRPGVFWLGHSRAHRKGTIRVIGHTGHMKSRAHEAPWAQAVGTTSHERHEKTPSFPVFRRRLGFAPFTFTVSLIRNPPRSSATSAVCSFEPKNARVDRGTPAAGWAKLHGIENPPRGRDVAHCPKMQQVRPKGKSPFETQLASGLPGKSSGDWQQKAIFRYTRCCGNK